MFQLTRRQKRKIKAYIRAYTARLIALCLVVGVLVGGFLLVRAIVRLVTGDEAAMETVADVKVEKWILKREKRVYEQPEFEVHLLPPNAYSRPGEPLEKIESVFVHYTANPNTTAA